MYFSQKEHKYYKNISEKSEYISASAVAEHYTEPFDGEYWSLYKAYEQLAGIANGIDMLDKEALKENFRKYRKGYKLRDYKLFKHLRFFFNDKEVKMVQQAIKEQWKTKNLGSKVKGSIYHDNREHEDLTRGTKVNPWTGNTLKVIKCNEWIDDDVKMRCVDLDSLEDGFYSEIIVDHWRFRGQIDMLYVENGCFWTDDYKTNERLEKENKFQKMKGVLSHLDDCNWNHYRIQLSVYNWILIKRGYNHAGSRLTHADIQPTGTTETIHEFDHMEREMEDIVMDLSFS